MLYEVITPADATPVNRCWGIVDTAPFPLTTTSDSWDDNQPTGCVGEWDNAAWGESPKGTELVNNIAIPDCAETIHKLDQTRPGVFDVITSYSIHYTKLYEQTIYHFVCILSIFCLILSVL